MRPEPHPRDEQFYETLRKRAVPDRLIRALARAPLVDEATLPTRRTLLSVTELSPAERRAIQGLSYGLTVPMIAATYGLAVTTVAGQVAAARAKLGAKNQAHAVALAIRRGLI